MRRLVLTALIGFCSIAAAPPVNAMSSRRGADIGATGVLIVADHVCPHGYHWTAAGYSRKGRWRPAHCEPDQRWKQGSAAPAR
jgi:hypothetical protein